MFLFEDVIEFFTNKSETNRNSEEKWILLHFPSNK